MEKCVKWAVIPCAGKGTRFLPITKGVSKEMLPIVDRPTLDYIVQELVDSGIKNIVFVISKGKDEIKKYYDKDPKYERELIKKGKNDFAKAIHEASNKANFYYVEQKEQLGLGHAVLCAKNIIKKHNFVVCCGDDICLYKKEAPTKQLIDCFLKNNCHTVVGGQKVLLKDISKYGCMDVLKKINSRTYELKNIVEKPKANEAPSDLASLGKWVFNVKIFDYIEKTKLGSGGEIQLTDAIALQMKDESVYFYDFVGTRFDCGEKIGYLKAILAISLNREDTKKDIKNFVKEIIK